MQATGALSLEGLVAGDAGLRAECQAAVTQDLSGWPQTFASWLQIYFLPGRTFLTALPAESAPACLLTCKLMILNGSLEEGLAICQCKLLAVKSKCLGGTSAVCLKTSMTSGHDAYTVPLLAVIPEGSKIPSAAHLRRVRRSVMGNKRIQVGLLNLAVGSLKVVMCDLAAAFIQHNARPLHWWQPAQCYMTQNSLIQTSPQHRTACSSGTKRGVG